MLATTEYYTGRRVLEKKHGLNKSVSSEQEPFGCRVSQQS